jgi:hypothetical protein
MDLANLERVIRLAPSANAFLLKVAILMASGASDGMEGGRQKIDYALGQVSYFQSCLGLEGVELTANLESAKVMPRSMGLGRRSERERTNQSHLF